MNLANKRHHRHSTRLPGWDYRNPGAYFVTLVTQDRELFFGAVEDDEMVLSPMGEIVTEEWAQTAIVRRNVALDEFVVMPNHLHGVIVLLGDEPTERSSPETNPLSDSNNAVAPADDGAKAPGPAAGSLGAIMAQFKSIVTKRIRALPGMEGVLVWQRNYYDHIGRNGDELRAIRTYIRQNPAKWAEDEWNPAGRVSSPAPRARVKGLFP